MFKLYKLYAKNKLKKLFAPKPVIPVDYEEIVQEKWATDFSNPEDARFEAEKGDGYVVSFQTASDPCLKLEAVRKNLYAWTLNPVFRYKNFILEADIHLDEPLQKVPVFTDEQTAGTFAAGFLFRYISQNAFYALLISNEGRVRLDAVVNSTPMPILGWIPVSEAENQCRYAVKIIANGTTLTLIINGVWIGCFEDDTIQAAGKIAFSLQNWAQHPSVSARLTQFFVDSRPLCVEHAYTEANTTELIPADRRFCLAQSFYTMGKYVPALLQIQDIWKTKKPETAEHLLAGHIYFAQRLMKEAETEFTTVLASDPDNEAALTELGSLYYHHGRYDELETHLKDISDKIIGKSPFLLNLKGHLFHAKGEHENAAEAYACAFALAPDQGLFALNSAHELIKFGKEIEAVETYLQAARAFLRSESYEDVRAVVAILERIAPDDIRSISLSAKYAYAIGNTAAALALLKSVCKKKSEDSSDWYLYGLLLKQNSMKDAVKALKKACKLEPNCGLYQFRLAEVLYLNGESYAPALQKALKNDSGNGWVHNLHALTALDEDDIERAAAAIAESRRLLPDEIAVLENYLEIERRKGRLEYCLPLFNIEAGTADCAVERNRAEGFHIIANALFTDGRYEDAAEWYRRAAKCAPQNAKILTDKAENDFALGLLHEADDGLVKALNREPSVRIYQLIAAICVQKGDYARAEVSLRTALDAFGESADVNYDLVSLYLTTKRFDLARHQLKTLQKLEVSDRVTALEKALV